jgi:hypothetical protein
MSKASDFVKMVEGNADLDATNRLYNIASKDAPFYKWLNPLRGKIKAAGLKKEMEKRFPSFTDWADVNFENLASFWNRE